MEDILNVSYTTTGLKSTFSKRSHTEFKPSKQFIVLMNILLICQNMFTYYLSALSTYFYIFLEYRYSWESHLALYQGIYQGTFTFGQIIGTFLGQMIITKG